jgi:hypothetical protein
MISWSIIFNNHIPSYRRRLHSVAVHSREYVYTKLTGEDSHGAAAARSRWRLRQEARQRDAEASRRRRAAGEGA